tara:strand:- start:1066 stop:1563 length:498 start_codon:yes stop_codon:yes gene_type:complete
MTNYLKISAGVLIVLSFSRFIPHPPNFTSLIALSFYIPAFLGRKYIFTMMLCFFITDLIIGLHSTLLFTWGSVLIIGFIANFFNKNIASRLTGTLISAVIFFIITNFGVWLSGLYQYNFNGILKCYYMAIPFFKNTIISTLLFSIIIELGYKIYLSKIISRFAWK